MTRPGVPTGDLVSGPKCCVCGQRPHACVIEGHICGRCAIDALPRLAATYVATATDGITDSNLETARMDEYFEGFGRRFWSALAKFKAHRASR